MSRPEPLVHFIGRGPVAQACALFLLRRGIPAQQIALNLETPRETASTTEWDRRALALSEGSRHLLARIIHLPPAGRIEHVDVSGRGRLGRTRIHAHDLGLPALGHVMAYRDLMDSLRTACRTVAWASPPGENLASGTTLVRIHADGAPGPSATTRDFQQSALLAEVQSNNPTAAHWAFERFTSSGPMALLPLAAPARWSLVWCDRPERCATRAAGSVAALEAELTAQWARRLGPLTLASPCQIVPLKRRARRRVVEGRSVWIGNAAQSLHPVAGQGLNLGLRDAFELADTLALAFRQGQALAGALSRWREHRAPDRWLTLALTDLMALSFTRPATPWVQSPLLATLDLLPTARRPLAHQLAFGWRHTPG
jgi:2-octaprenyl-6-methoxyphenol hydroxylase